MIGQMVRVGMFVLLIAGTLFGMRGRKPKNGAQSNNDAPIQIDDPVKALKNVSWRVRVHAVKALGDLRDEAHISALADMLADSDSDVREGAVEALAKFGKIALPDVIEKLQQGMVDCRESAAHCLAKIGDKSAVPALTTTLNHDESAWVREAAANALGFIGGVDAVVALIARLTDPDADVRKAVRAALKHIGTPDALQALKNKD